MEEENKKYKNRALIGTIVFHAVLVLCIILFGLTTPLPLPEEEGVLVSLGFSEQGRGDRQPLTSSPPPPQPQPSRSSEAAEDVATQSTEESVAIPDTPRDREQPRETTRPEERPRPQETVQEQPQPEPEPQVNPNALFPGRDRQTTTSQNQGDTGESGNQGRPDGSTDGTSTTGGGQGDGPSFSLAGRSPLHRPLPDYNSQSQGKVVVTITVNRQGQVIRATAGARGTTTSDPELWAAAEAAAMKSRASMKDDAPHEQKGTITYIFIKQN